MLDHAIRSGCRAALALPVALETPAATIEVAHGLGATIPIKLTRTKGADGALVISTPSIAAGAHRRERDDRRQGHRGHGHGQVRRRGPLGDGDRRLAGERQDRWCGAQSLAPPVVAVDRRPRDRRIKAPGTR